MSIERGDGFNFATQEQLEELYVHTEEAALRYGRQFLDSEVYGYQDGVIIADMGMRHSLGVRPREAWKLSDGRSEVLGDFKRLDISHWGEYYAYDDRDEFGHELMNPSITFHLDRKRNNPIERENLSIDRQTNADGFSYGEVRMRYERNPIPATSAEDVVRNVSRIFAAWEMESRLGSDRITRDEAQALTLIVKGLSSLWRLQYPWRHFPFVRTKD